MTLPAPSSASRYGVIFVDRCRACGGPCDPIATFGDFVLSDYLPPDAPDPPAVPLAFGMCGRCNLVQLAHTVDRDSLYRQYYYLSGINEVMRAELEDVVKAARRILGGFLLEDYVIDVGANDGTLLGHIGGFHGLPTRIAFEPALNLQEVLRTRADAVYADYFPGPDSSRLLGHSIRLLTSIACFYDLADPKAFVAEVDRLLTLDGLWIVQMQDLAQMVEATAFDNICAEHLAYYSTETFNHLLEAFDLRIVGVEQRAINGGSLRYYIRRRHHPDLASPAVVPTHVAKAREVAAVSWDGLLRFAWRVKERTTQIRGAVESARAKGQAVDLYAASTKSSTLLQACGLSHAQIRCAVERSPAKYGLVTSGTRIPIVSEDQWRQDPAPLTLLGAWQFKDAFLQRERAYLEGGGSFLVPLPSVQVIYGA